MGIIALKTPLLVLIEEEGYAGKVNIFFEEVIQSNHKNTIVCLFQWNMYMPVVFFDIAIYANIARWIHMIAVKRFSKNYHVRLRLT